MATLDFNPNGKKVILSIDGGGMRGTISIAMLAELERMTGKTCQQLFDMVAGTSTGAIIAAGIAIGMTAQQLLEVVYRDKLPKAFPKQDLSFWLRYITGGLKYLYPLETFREALAPLAQGQKIRDITHPIILLTTKDVRTSNTYYITNAGPGAATFADWPLSGAVAASGAAPIFFPPVAGNLVDGGVGVYGNPCLAAAIEAMEYIGAERGFTPGNVIEISLGTGYPTNERADGEADRYWLLDWIKYIIIAGMDEAQIQQAFNVRAIYRDQMDFRRYNPLLTRENLETNLGILTEGRPNPSELGLDSFAPEQIALMEDIGRVYAHHIDWTKENQMPWDTVGGHGKPRALPVNWAATNYR